ncbi:autotransporter assembly complex protein TamA [Segnochrobactraceae bacterium EtOH-i3]
MVSTACVLVAPSVVVPAFAQSPANSSAPEAAAAPADAASTKRASPTFFGRAIAWFRGDKADGGLNDPVYEATPYTVNLTVDGKESSVVKAMKSASSLMELESTPPSGAAGLARRARADRDRLTATLFSLGRYGGCVTITIAGKPLDAPDILAVIDAARKKGPVPIDILVEPGPEFTFGKISLVDAKTGRPLTDIATPEDLGLDPGAMAKSDLVVAAERRIITRLRDSGHPFAAVPSRDVTADHRTRELDVTYRVAPGPVARFGPVTIEGTKSLSPEFIRERLTFHEGEKFDPARIARFRTDMNRVESIQSVQVVEADHLDANGQLPITVVVRERKLRYVGFGARYSTTDGAVLNAYWGHRNLFGGGETLRLDAEGSWFGDPGPNAVPSDNNFGYNLSAKFMKPGIFTPADDLIAEAAVLRDRTDAYITQGVTALVGVRHRFSERLTTQISLDYENADTTDFSGTSQQVVVGFPIWTVWDSTDNPLDATKGFKADVTVEPFAQLGDEGAGPAMFKGTFSAYHAFDPRSRYVLAGRVGAGVIVGADLSDIPPQRRFYAGGGGSVRGYGYQEASPRDANGTIVGGTSLLEASVEMRIKLTDTIGVVPFFDAGAAFADSTPDVFSPDMKYSAGLGLRYYTAVGPVRADVGIPLNPSDDDSKFGLYLSLGQAF